MRDYDIESDLKQEKFQSIKLVQGDRGNKIKINVYEDGQPVNLTGCSITAKYKRADGQVINGSVTNISNNSFDAVIDSDITKVAGTLKMLFNIENGDVKVSTFLLLADIREGIGENTGSSGGDTEVTVDLKDYQKKTDNGLETKNKYIVGAINEVNSQCKEIANKIDEISNPFNINSFTVSPSTAQKGSTINVTVKWSYNKDINSQTLNNATLDVTLREKTFSSVNADVTYTLNATSTNNISKAKSETVKFYNGIYYGKSSSTTYDSALINSLTKVLSDSKARTITVNAGTREYIYYCLPSRLGTPNFNVGGFDGGFDKVETVSFTNSDGYTENYDIYKSNNANLGNTTIVIK